MTDDEYTKIQARIPNWAEVSLVILRNLDLDGFLERLEHAETLGYVLDPTLAMRAADGVEKVKTVASAARICRRQLETAQ